MKKPPWQLHPNFYDSGIILSGGIVDNTFARAPTGARQSMNNCFVCRYVATYLRIAEMLGCPPRRYVRLGDADLRLAFAFKLIWIIMNFFEFPENTTLDTL